MSYDLLVFDPAEAPLPREKFEAWYQKLTEWERSADFDDYTHLTPNLRAWFDEMIKRFPPMNGPLARDENIDNDHCTGYTITPHAIYIDFRWSVADTAYAETRRVAEMASVGFYDVSGDGEIWRPPPRAVG